jgi:sodium/potassium-transporting ATPase subunit alpha
MRITRLSPEEAVASLRGSPAGLYSPEARRRLAEYGPNRVEEAKGESLALRFLREFVHFFALILWLAAGLAFVADLYGPGQGMVTLGWAIVGVIAINGFFSFWQEYRAERAIAALKRLLPHQVTALRDGLACRLPAEELVPGDVVLVGEGESVPADCRLIESFAVRVNLATITGESLPKARSAAASAEDDLLRSHNVLLAGSTVVAGEGKALVFATGMHTEFGKIARLTQAGGEPPSPLQREIARLSRLVALLATALGIVFFLIGRLLGLSFWENFIFAIGIIVANVPEGLLPEVTLSLAMATRAHPAPPGGRGARRRHGHLHGQDRNAHGESHGREAPVHQRWVAGALSHGGGGGGAPFSTVRGRRALPQRAMGERKRRAAETRRPDGGCTGGDGRTCGNDSAARTG